MKRRAGALPVLNRIAGFRAQGFALLSTVLIACAGGPKPVDDVPGGVPRVAKAPERAVPATDRSAPEVAVGIQGAVTTQDPHSTDVGLAVLQRGGNAVDAAVAVGFAMAVGHPSAGNLGGGGFMVIRMADGTTTAIDFREKAPGAAHRDMYLDKDGNPTKDSRIGPLAAGIPGTVAGLALAHARFGTLPWKDLVEPAVKLAQDGLTLDSWHAEDLAHGAKRMADAGFDASAAYYRKADGTPFAEGDTWKQPELGATLAQIAEHGPRAFYEGPFATQLAEGVRKAGGIWTPGDLAAYEAKEREAIVFPYRGHEVITMPPPSAGGVVLRQLLGASESLDLQDKPWRSADEIHLHVEACRRTYADRNLLLGDPDFVKMPLERLLDTKYIRDRMSDVTLDKATPSDQIGAGVPVGHESEETTHYSAIDGAGNGVSTTYTLNTGFGARFVVPGTGVLLNNEMDDFAAKPGTPNLFGLVQGEQNAVAPGKRMLSSMSPTILVKDNKVRAVVGSPGGPTITTTVAQIIRALVDYGQTIDAAVRAVRVHHQWKPDMIWSESALDAEIEAELVKRGHQIRKRGSIGHANCIEVDPATQGFRAVADVGRDGGKAAAY